ncbi:MAG: N-acetyl-gamma-glutamyl-phosphate reductase [Pseudomonadales bacterium]|nr:N-acetyl-gamma-glutamyl-phosphate reductase [Pseudomonadales bacterium]
MHKIFIDGQAGTTGLQIHNRLHQRHDIQLLTIDDQQRKDPLIKHDLIQAADIIVLCLPDEAAKETVALAADTDTRILDASTAFRTDPDWAYGLAELNPGQRQLIASADKVSNPGCYPTGFLLAVAPLIAAGILNPGCQLSISAVSGYSGGGHNMIDRYVDRQVNSYSGKQQPSADDLWCARPYGLKFGHKHLAEMQHYADLQHAPLFMPSVGHYLQGMLVSTPLASTYFNHPVTVEDIQACLAERYSSEPCVPVHTANTEQALDQGFLDPQGVNGTNRCDLYVYGNNEQIMLIAQLDNLGKGAAGAAVQNLNIMLGIDELTSLSIDL